MYEVEFYQTLRGDAPVRDFIDELPERQQNKVLGFIKKLRVEGHLLRRPTAGHLGDKLWELRPDDNRILYAFYDRAKIVLLHAVTKKKKELDQRDLDLASVRLDDWLMRTQR